MRKRPEIPKHLQKKVARQLLERQKRAGVYEKGLKDVGKGFLAGSAYPVDIAEMVAKPGLTQSASVKAASMRPRGGGIPETVAPVQDPKLKGTYPYVARKMGLDPDSAEGIAGSFFSLDPMAKAHAVAMGTKMVAGQLAGLGLGASVFGGLKKVDDAADVAKPIFTSPGAKATADISKETIPANKVKSQLEGRGVNKDEMEWTGFNEWIKTKKGEVSKAEIEEFFQQNQIQVQEVIKGGKADVILERNPEHPEIFSIYRADDPEGEFYGNVGEIIEHPGSRDAEYPFLGHTHYEVNVPGLDREKFSTLEKAKEFVHDNTVFGGTTKWQSWQLPGGENYRELLLIVPPKKVPYTRENVIPVTADDYYYKGRPGIRFDNAEDVYYFFKTPDGTERIPKRQGKATGELPEGYSIKPVTGRNDAQFTLERPDGGGTILPGAETKQEATEQALKRAEIAEELTIPKQEFNISQEEALEQVLARQPSPKPRYTGGHFQEDDVVAHIRFNERVDPDGNKVLFIEEIQSDWAHKGQSEGFYTAGSRAAEKRMGEIGKRQQEIRDEIKELGGAPEDNYGLGEEGQKKMDEVTAEMNEWSAEWANLGPIPDWAQAKANRLKKKAEEIRALYDPHDGQKVALMDELKVLTEEYEVVKRKDYGYVPEGPFVQDIHQWTNLALKRMVRWGSDNGFDSIGWVTGKQSADRYNVSTHVSRVKYRSDGYLSAHDKEGREVFTKYNVIPEKLVDYIGKEPANKLLKQDALTTPSGLTAQTLEGIDLDIGGEYHKLIYDQVLTAQAKKIGKKHGAKVEQKAPFEIDMAALVKEWNELSARRNESLRRGKEGVVDYEFTPEDDRRLIEISKKMSMEGTDEVDRIGNVWTMPLTDKLKNAAKDGMPYYVALPPLVMGAAAQRSDAQRQQSKSDAQSILAN